MLLGCIADDFTGASDLANTLAKGGMAVTQFVGVPGSAAPHDCEAGVVALKTRSIAADKAIAQSTAALEWLRRQGCRQFFFKYCSTFDSTPDGNIGPVAEALLEALDASVAVVCPAFPATGRTLYRGHLFVNGGLLSESGMENHPLNPMTDPDIRRWLSLQTRGEVGLLPYEVVRQGAAAIRDALSSEAEAGRRLVVVDALVDDDLAEIGAAVADEKLVTGGSGVALALPKNFREGSGAIRRGPEVFSSLKGPGVVLSGSCSATSRGQVATYLDNHPGLAVDPNDLVLGTIGADKAAAFARDTIERSPIIYTTDSPGAVRAAQERHGRETIAAAIEAFFGEVARRLVDCGVTRIAVGGGETSGAVVTALGLEWFRIGPEIDPGVPILAAEGRQPVHLALKSGNFGASDFFAKALDAMGGQ
jgi:uncharacterized protein YgbK (DUF1537 family)